MKKVNNKSIFSGFKILSILAFSLLIVPSMALASYGYGYGTNIYYQTGNGGGLYNSPTEINNPKPFISLINPYSSNVGVGTKTVTITGNGFIPSSVAKVNGSNRPTTFIDYSHLLVQVSGNDMYAYRTNNGFFITVFNEGPGGGYSNAAFFTVNTITTPVGNTNNNSNSSDTSSAVGQTKNTTDSNADTNGNSLASNAIFGSDGFLPSGLVQWILFAIIILLIIILGRKVFGVRKNYEEAPMKHA